MDEDQNEEDGRDDEAPSILDRKLRPRPAGSMPWYYDSRGGQISIVGSLTQERIAEDGTCCVSTSVGSTRGGMHDQAKETVSARYRRHARECLEIANKVKSDEVRACLIEMARVWVQLAEQRENI